MTAGSALAEDFASAEKQAYCQYVREQAQAERTLATGLTMVGRLGQPDTNTAEKQAVLGVSKSLSKHLQGNVAIEVGNLECELYAHTTDLQRVLKYQLASIDQHVAQQRVQATAEVLAMLDEEIDQAERRKDSGNATIADVLALDQRRQQLFTQYRAAQQTASNPAIPPLRQIDPRATLQQIDALTLELQTALNRKQRLQTWDVALVVGTQKPILSSSAGGESGAHAYASVSFTYNLNARAYANQLNKTSASLIALHQQQNDELTQQVGILLKAVDARSRLDREALPRLTAEVSRLAEESARIRNIDTPEALRMRALLRIHLAVATMEQRLAADRLAMLAQATSNAS